MGVAEKLWEKTKDRDLVNEVTGVEMEVLESKKELIEVKGNGRKDRRKRNREKETVEQPAKK